MKYFIAIVPPAKLMNQIIQFQRKWENNRIQHVAEPHITVKAQSGLTEDLNWLESIRNVLVDVEGFDLTLKEPRFFSNAVLYIHSDSEELDYLHRRLMNAVSPATEERLMYMEDDRFIQHLTIGQTRWGLTEKELREMREQIEGEIPMNITFRVNYLRVYHEVEENVYCKYLDLPLGRGQELTQLSKEKI
ncbi:hypothetical protein Q75_06675 [Bacillus coahuilensis p1.1.43]|uniref:2'-5' RNA ligase n=1 Tax=Bacillus coahuilensis p1.1.43 TaxID=1150625 RepID=A0A147K973_9BACI|nr:2'-5' RNA ligase family protein [Bacillus coahuilensis]KUP06894.1 hypothetical protein Q75_06675 [Bacillus coahuilensis p1.1.43]